MRNLILKPYEKNGFFWIDLPRGLNIFDYCYFTKIAHPGQLIPHSQKLFLGRDYSFQNGKFKSKNPKIKNHFVLISPEVEKTKNCMVCNRSNSDKAFFCKSCGSPHFRT